VVIGQVRASRPTSRKPRVLYRHIVMEYLYMEFILFIYLICSRTAGLGPAGPTSRRARFSERTRPTRLTNLRLLANPSHRHNRLLIYRRCHYFLIFPLLTYCCPHYIFFAQDGRQKTGVPEAEVVQNRQFIPTIVVLI